MPTLFRAVTMSLAAVALARPAPVAADETTLRVIETERSIRIQQHDVTVLVYNKVSPPAPAGVDPIYRRSGCLHPVNSPRGHTVTGMFPADHRHQHGVFSAWVKTTYDDRVIDFWNLGARQGRVLHHQVLAIIEEPGRAGFEVELIHRIEQSPAVDVLREHWKVMVHATDGTYHQFDLETTQSAMTSKPLLVNKHHYGGFAVRGPTRWLTEKDSDVRKRPELLQEPSGFVNSLGSKRVTGNHEHANWVSLWGECDGQPVSITVLCHAGNFRAPQAARLHPTKPYFCYAPCVDGEFVIDQQHPLQSRYRFIITDAMPNQTWLDQQWRAWCDEAETDK
jgi:hypothetical protein